MCFSSVYGFWSLLWYLLPVNFYNKCSVTKLRTCKITAYIGYYVFLQFMALDRPFVTFSLYILISFNFQNCVLFGFYFILVIGLSFSFNLTLYIPHWYLVQTSPTFYGFRSPLWYVIPIHFDYEFSVTNVRTR